MSGPFAYFITLSAYGDRMHGDQRGSVDRRREAGDWPFLDPNPVRQARETMQRTWPAMLFESKLRVVIEDSFAETCAFRGWMLLAVHCRTNHVHAVVAADEAGTSEVLHRLKSYATRTLREQELVEDSQPVWSRHGSTRMLWTDEDVEAAVEYTMNHQGEDLTGTSEWRKRRNAAHQ